ncbi:hypothetical protein [Mesorhizobium sp. IMUNJ 23232]|uniref:hypothetical protein n=1 Tax=Mesorhizobium sp. IMUNJ 23232 TaxID=3376064 RepID=UPI0037A9EBAC
MGAGQVCGTSSGRSRTARILGLLLGGLLSLALSTAVEAEEDELSEIVEECTAPCAEFEITTELQGDRVFAATPPALKSYVLQPTITADLVVAPTDYLRLATSIITEPVVDPAPGADAVFAGIGTYVAELYTMVEAGPTTTRLGKFDTIFSLFSEVAPGINADDLASDFDADERMWVGKLSSASKASA